MDSRQPVRRKTFGKKLSSPFSVGQQRTAAVGPNTLFDARDRRIQPNSNSRRVDERSIGFVDVRSAAQRDNGLTRFRKPTQMFALELTETRLSELRENLAN